MDISVLDVTRIRANLSMAECIDVMASAMTAVTQGTMAMPPRAIVRLIDGSGYLGVMPESALVPRVYGVKVASLHPGNAKAGRPVIQGFVALFDPETGSPVALLDGAEITALRTGAASGLATRLLARPDARTLGLLGYGVQASSHLEAICAVRTIEAIRVWGPSIVKARQFADRHAAAGRPKIVAVSSPEEAANCDVVCVVTSAHQPVVRGAWVMPGSHVNLVGAHTPDTRESDTALIQLSRVFVDSMAAMDREAGDILIPIRERAIDRSHVAGEIGALLLGRVAGRRSAEEVTTYKSLGLAAQDLVAAYAVYTRWRAATEV